MKIVISIEELRDCCMDHEPESIEQQLTDELEELRLKSEELKDQLETIQQIAADNAEELKWYINELLNK